MSDTDNAYTVQLAEGFRKLRFNPGLEMEFREAYVQQHLLRTRLGLAAVVALYLLFMAVKWRLDAGAAQHWGLLLRATIIGSTLLVLAVTYVERLRFLLPPLTVANYVVFSACIAGIQVVARRYGLEHQYEALILMSFHLFMFSGLIWRAALASGGLVWVSYLLVGAFGGLADRAWVYQLLYIGLSLVIGAAALYSIEWVERDNFLRRRVYAVLAAQDSLTGLFNRRAFFSQGERLLRQAARQQVSVGVVMIDIDHFKAYNDRYGHIEGDVCLQQVAESVRQEFRRPLDLLGRYGGEEFIGLWYDVPPDSVRAIAEQVRAAVQARKIPHAGAPSGRVTASLGVMACAPDDHETLMALVQRADRALYEAKERGRNRVVADVRASSVTTQAARRRSQNVSAG